MEKRLLNINELSEYLGYTKGTLYVLVHQKRVPYVKNGRSLRFDIIEIDRWIKSNAVPAGKSDFDLKKLI